MTQIRLSFVLVLAIISANVFAQSESVKVTIRAIWVYGEHNAPGEDEDYRFRFWYNDTEKPNNTGCLGVGTTPYNWVSVNYTLVSNLTVGINEDITLAVEAWEEDGCKDGCRYNDTDLGCDDGGKCGKNNGVIESVPGDSYLGTGGSSFRLSGLRPGNVTTNEIQIAYCSYKVVYRVTYTPPTPSIPTFTAYDPSNNPYTGSYQLCTNNRIDLATSSSLSPNFNNQVKYEWYFNINGETQTVYVDNPDYCGTNPACDGGGGPGDPVIATFSFQQEAGKLTNAPLAEPIDPGGPPPCCYEPPFLETTETRWTKIPGSDNPSLASGGYSFNVRALKTFKWDLSKITQTAVVNFKVKIITNGTTSSFSGTSLTLNVAPLPPAIPGDPLSDPSCPNSNSGIIHVTNVTGTGIYKYNLRPGFNNDQPCNPETDGSCFSGNVSGSVSGVDFDINGVGKGQYTLWLVNNGGSTGSCFTTKNVEVTAYETLALTLGTPTDVSCHGTATGMIVLGKTGGKSPFTYTLTSQASNTTGEFPNLVAGAYTATVIDGCAQSIEGVTNKTVTIYQPVKISKSILDPEDATCSSPGNGSVAAAVTISSGAYDVAKSTPFKYKFKILKDGIGYDSIESTTASWTRAALPVDDNYVLWVTEKNGTECNGYSESFSVGAPDALTISAPVTDSVSCFGKTDGEVSFTGSGGSGEFLFKMSRIAGDTVESTTGAFSGLRAGSYKLLIENALAGCNDKAVYPSSIIVKQPNRITAVLDETDISCFGKKDGIISAVLSGGTPGYTSYWELQIGSGWSSLPVTGTYIDGRGEGVYRLKITDSKNCTDSSAAVVIDEPELLEITNVSVNDIKCLNEKGTIEITADGGTGGYTYFYSLNGAAFTTFTGSTPLNEGSYVVKVEDENNCPFTDAGTYIITSPPAILDFTYEQSDFNGLNISCFGGSNGHVIISASGGNGGSYSGYEFARDNGTYQIDTRIDGFNAGDHLVSVRDDRGCVVTKNVLFTQSDSAINIALESKEDIICYGDETGVLKLKATGGLKPYLFAIDNGEKQDEEIFSGLGQGVYHATVYDKNNCDNSFDYTIELLNPRIEINAEIKNVSCFEGSDASIVVSINGGVDPLQYSWEGQNNITSTLSNVKAGNYKIVVSDNAGCQQDSTLTVTQPAKALENKIAVVPVCFGRTNGVITIYPTGGTSPYQFSVNNGQTFQNDPVFNTVGVGDYSIKVIDNNGCVSTGSAKIIQRNDQPSPDFIVATKEHARDTLLITEISLPKPDSIHWIFDPAAIVVGDDQWAPEITFAEAGQYQITMIGYFQACDYSATRTITLSPYDPNALPPTEPDFRPIESVEVGPNPNDGEFDVSVKLNKKYRLSIIIYDVLGGIHYFKSFDSVQEAVEKITLPQAAAGVYLLRAVTNTDARDVRLIINK